MSETHTAFYKSEIGFLRAIGSDDGLHELEFTDLKSAPHAEVPACLKECFGQLDEYFSGELKNFSLTSLPANILVLPLTPVSMFLGFLTGVSGMFWSILGQFFGILAYLVSSYQLAVIKFLAGFPLSSFPISINWILLVLSYALIFYFLFRLNKNKSAID